MMISLVFMLSGCMIGDMYYRMPAGRRNVSVIIIFILIFTMIRIIVQSLRGKRHPNKKSKKPLNKRRI